MATGLLCGAVRNRSRIDDRFGAGVAELVDAIAFDVLELRRERAFLRPFPERSEADVANHGLERGFAHVIGEHIIVQALRCGDSVAEDLQVGICLLYTSPSPRD